MSSGSGDGPRLVVTADDHRAVVVIVVIICVVWSIFVVGARAIWRFHQKSSFGLDDSVALLGTLLSIAQAGLTLKAVHYGFGQRERLLEPQRVEQAGKQLYGAALLYILALCASRASMPLLIARLTRDRTQLFWTRLLLAVILVWGFASTFAVAFQCGLPVPWGFEARTTCPDIFTTYAAIESLGLLIESLIIAAAVSLVAGLNMLTKFKVAVVGSFALRALLIIPVAWRLVLLRRIAHHTAADPLFASVNLIVVTQVILHYSLWAASFPCMRAFLRAFDTGMGVTTGVPTYKGSNYNHDGTRNSSFAMRSFSRSHSNARRISNSLSKEILRRSDVPPSPTSTTTPTTAGSSWADPDVIEKMGGGSLRSGAARSKRISQACSDAGVGSSSSNASHNFSRRKHTDETASQHSKKEKAIITRTVEWTVEVHDSSEEANVPGRAL